MESNTNVGKPENFEAMFEQLNLQIAEMKKIAEEEKLANIPESLILIENNVNESEEVEQVQPIASES